MNNPREKLLFALDFLTESNQRNHHDPKKVFVFNFEDPEDAIRFMIDMSNAFDSESMIYPEDVKENSELFEEIADFLENEGKYSVLSNQLSNLHLVYKIQWFLRYQPFRLIKNLLDNSGLYEEDIFDPLKDLDKFENYDQLGDIIGEPNYEDLSHAVSSLFNLKDFDERFSAARRNVHRGRVAGQMATRRALESALLPGYMLPIEISRNIGKYTEAQGGGKKKRRSARKKRSRRRSRKR